MSAYLIAEISDISDPDTFKEYGANAARTIAEHGGKVLIAGGCEALEGDWRPGRVVVLEFETMEALKGWYKSSEYQALIPRRHESASGNIIICEGH